MSGPMPIILILILWCDYMIVNNEDDFLYIRLIELIQQIKLVQGASAIAPTLRRHKPIRDYLFDKQKSIINHIEDTYFLGGDLNQLSIENYHSRQRKKSVLH